MNSQEQDELLIRLDERTANIIKDLSESENSVKKSIEKISTQQKEQNIYISGCLGDIKSHETALNFIKWTSGFIITAILAIVGFFINHLRN